MDRFSVRTFGAYGFALLTVAAASAARFAVDPIAHDKGPFLFFAFAVVAAALHGGLRGGLTATILGLIIADYLFVNPRHTFFIYDAMGDSTMMALFAALGIALSVIIERSNLANARVRQSREELTGANALLQAHERELHLANERFQVATEAANEAIWEWNAETQTASWGDFYSRRFGRPPGESSCQWWFDHIHPEDRERVRSSFLGALNGNTGTWQCEYRMLCAAGNWAAIYDRGTIARSAEGKPLRVTSAMLDITETKRIHEELERRTEELARSNEDLQRFAFVVSHDLQAPLRMIGDHSRHLVNANLNEESARVVASILDGVGRMRAIIQDLLEFARVSSEPAAPNTCTDSNFILDLALQHLQSRIREAQAQITADRLPLVAMNEARLLRVFQNLIGNGLQYCEQTPRIHISARPGQQTPEMWVFSVKDNGIGIAPEYHERIFALFKRLHSGDRFPGTGIGLAVVKRIIEAYGGRIWLDSDIGRGSTFYFDVRAADRAATSLIRE